MTRLKPSERRQIVEMVRARVKKKDTAKAFGVSRTTVWKWCKRAKHRGRESFRGRPVVLDFPCSASSGPLPSKWELVK